MASRSGPIHVVRVVRVAGCALVVAYGQCGAGIESPPADGVLRPSACRVSQWLATATRSGAGEQTRVFVYIDDVVQANLRAATTDAVGEAYTIATGTALSIRILAERIRAVADADSEIVHGPAREGDIRHSVAEIDRARTALGFEPTVDVDAGLERTIEWFHNRQG